MELRNDPKIFEVTPASKMFFILCVVCVLSLCIQCGHGKSLSQEQTKLQDQFVPNNKPAIYVEISSWENRTGYPRFLIYRDHFRRQQKSLEADNKNDGSPQLTSYSKPIVSARGINDENPNGTTSSLPSSQDTSASGESDASGDENDFSSSLERLLAERKQKNEPIIPTPLTVNSNRSGNDGIVSEPNFNDFMAMPSPQDKQVINFPKDKTNPCNRLQINPDDEEQTEIKRESGSQESLEIGNRQNFPGSSSDKQKIDEFAEVDAIRDAVPTVDLTMKIIEQSRWNEENVIFSPLSIVNVLSMLLLGSGGETFKELSMELDKHKSLLPSSEWSIERYHLAFKKLLVYLRKYSGTGVMLSSASEIFVDKSFPINPKFEKELLSYYEAPVESFDFGKEGYVFVDRVNKWVREKTHNQIKTILEEPPSDSTTMGIINAIYFKGAWEVPFSDKITRLRDFRVHPKEKVKAQMMLNILTIPYIERERYRMTAVPYKDNQTALFLILPKGNDGINDLKKVERSLTRQELNESITWMNDTKLALTLPKLKFSSDGEMKTILENMGLSTLFKQANFSGISEETEGLYISRILHRAAVEINEKGTEASAVTLGTADRIIDDPPIPFGCDKPFLFFIYHIKADTILFWGRVIRPDSKHLT